MNRKDVLKRYRKKCDEARNKYNNARKNKFINIKKGNKEEAYWDELEQESFAKEFSLLETFIGDLEELN